MRYLVWILLSLPAVYSVLTLPAPETWTIDTLRPATGSTGEYAAWLIILSLAITPLARLLPGNAVIRWLRSNRRYFGVASFGYSVLHTVLFFLPRGLAGIWGSLHYSIITGWVALFILVPLAATSNDLMVRRLGPRWKKLQRWGWIAAVFVFLHWITLHRFGLVLPALISFLPLILLLPVRFRSPGRDRRA